MTAPDRKPGLVGLADRAKDYFSHQGINRELSHRVFDVTTGFNGIIDQAGEVTRGSLPRLGFPLQDELQAHITLSKNNDSGAGDGVKLLIDVTDSKLPKAKSLHTEYLIGYNGNIVTIDHEGVNHVVMDNEMEDSVLLLEEILAASKEALEKAINQQR
mgnify:CR=1 FL=1